MKKLIGLCLILVVSLNAEAQKLDRLRERSAAFWSLRIAGNNIESSKFVDAAARNLFSQSKDPHFLNAEIFGIEFSDSPSLATVITKVRMMTMEIGEVKRDIREVWVWSGKDWFVRPEGVPLNPFSKLAKPAAAAADAPLEFEFSTAAINLGSRVQGEMVSGRVEFKSDRNRISLLLPAQSADLQFTPAEWKDQQTASMGFTFDTTLLVGSVLRTLKFRILDQAGKETARTLQLQAEIQGRVRFTQVPDPLDTTKAGIAELLIQNLTSEPIRIAGITSSGNFEDFQLGEEWKRDLNTGEISTIKVHYGARKDQAGPSVLVTFSKPVLGKSVIVFPFRMKQPEIGPAQYTPEQLQEIMRTQPKVPPQ